MSGVASTTCANLDKPAWQAGLGGHTPSATATDHAGNTGLLCVKLEHAAFPPFVNELPAQAGKSLTPAQVQTLIRLALALQPGRH